jgi:hypothetical protein
MKRYPILFIVAALTGLSFAKVDLVTLPTRDRTQLTIYESADLTLVRDSRDLTLKEGQNRLQFSWAGTLIDPTSLSMLPRAHADQIEITDLTYPSRVQNLGLWTIESRLAGPVPFEITYLTSGLSWRAFYMGTLAGDEKTMRLEGYVRVSNHSGEDYENAQVRLIVGQVHILDQIADLARRAYPYGRPDEFPRPVPAPMTQETAMKALRTFDMAAVGAAKPKEIVKEGLSEYFLYTIEGTETIPNQWSKRLPSFDADQIPVVNLYKFEEEMYGPDVVRYLSFKNDGEHKLGQTPIPGGMLRVYRSVDRQGHLSYEGQSAFKYIPVGEEVQLNLGPAANVLVEPKLMEYRTDNYCFDERGNINGWDQIQHFRIEIKNTRNLPIKLEIKRNFSTSYWNLENRGPAKKAFEKVDVDTVKYTLQMEPRSEQILEYVLTTYEGTRQEAWTKQSR